MGIVSCVELTKTRAIIYVDGVVFLRLRRRDFDEVPVFEGDDLEEKAYLDQLCSKQAKPAYEAALALLSARDMTRHDLCTAIIRRGYLPKVADLVAQRLQENGLINDERFAKRYVELHQDSDVGRYQLRQKLRSKGIDAQTAEDALEDLDEERQLESAKAYAARLTRRYAGDEIRVAKRKLSQALARRGFSWEIVSATVDSIYSSEDEW